LATVALLAQERFDERLGDVGGDGLQPVVVGLRTESSRVLRRTSLTARWTRRASHRKLAERKTRREALRALKRQLANVMWRHLVADLETTVTATGLDTEPRCGRVVGDLRAGTALWSV
jgi:hypothetical protein